MHAWAVRETKLTSDQVLESPVFFSFGMCYCYYCYYWTLTSNAGFRMGKKKDPLLGRANQGERRWLVRPGLGFSVLLGAGRSQPIAES